MNFKEGEMLLINKPLRWTSFDVVNKIRYAVSKKTGERIKVGHAGTLDPLATGLLIICTGKMTKCIDEFSGMNKEYTGTFFLGATTPSFDTETEVDATFAVEHIDTALLEETRKKFMGESKQLPPIYSAIKIGGKTAYEQARKGKKMKMEPRTISISEFELTRVAIPEVDFRVLCSKGTYIRSLAYDFGKALKSGAYLQSLCRTEIGKYNLKDALTIDDCISIISGA